MMKKIGLFGGTFDPVHNGHLIIAEYLRDELQLDEIWFIPAKIHPLKDNQEITPPHHRLEMLKLAVTDNKFFTVSDMELKREGMSYTVDTIDGVLKSYSKTPPKLYFFIGMDNVNDLHRWKAPEKILKKCQVVAFGRPGFTPDEQAKPFLSSIQFVHVPLLEISSTFVRRRLHHGHTVRYLIPEAVERYIKEKQLYK